MEKPSRPNRFYARMLKLDFDFSENLRKKLIKIQTSVDLRNISEERFIQKYSLTPEEIQELHEAFEARKLKLVPKSFFDPWLEEHFLTTGSRRFDKTLGGEGISIGKITQISGTAGAGKTQFCFKLCLTVQLEPSLGGFDGEALYLETEDCFRPERILEMAQEMKMYKHRVLDRIHRYNRLDQKLCQKTHNVEDLIENLNGTKLEEFLGSHQAIKLFIIDSISYNFRYEYEGSEMLKLHQQTQIGNRLKYLADKYQLAIVITNQVKLSEELPAMGDIWNSIPSTAILLRRNDTVNGFQREAKVLKSIFGVFNSNDNRSDFKYKIGKSGIEEI